MLIAVAAVVAPAVLGVQFLLGPVLATTGAAAMVLAVLLLGWRPSGARR